ncbi:flippase [Chryseobacterium sp. FH1]|uniref:flippase n=1 Tax=Chryseobacterium sp. FH1 TaxID=1233951 RepID=UPI0004E3F9BD|nr:flippase [Chryseobacterium sp. FH1]KFC20002.1 polysaccharide biosynthesis protein [Chryseobacterium sp. FH1]
MAKSIKSNFVYNLINTSLGILFPLISFPYASRILMAEGIGEVNFFQSIIQYVLLLTSLGIPMYAIREIAKVRDDVTVRNKTLLEVLILNLILTVIGYFLIFIITLTVAKIQVNIPLFLILSLSIILTTVGCDWFYQGVEDFKYITIRGIIVRSLSLILLFLLVKTQQDILYYAICITIGSVGGNVFNFFRLRKYIKVSDISSDLKPFRHLKPVLRIFVLNLIISIYINLNVIMLGFMKSNESVGLFTSATKLTHVILTMVTSLGVVLLPRMSNMIQNNQLSEFRELAQKSLDIIVALTLPISFGLILLADFVIPIFCGDTYVDAILTLKILSPIIIFIGISNVLGIQILYPQGHEKIVIFSTAIGAIVNFILNLWLIPLYSQNGAAVSTLFAELLVTVMMCWIGKRLIWVKWKKQYWIYALATLAMVVAVSLIKKINLGFMQDFAISILAGFIIYLLFLKFTKDPLYITARDILSNKLNIKTNTNDK